MLSIGIEDMSSLLQYQPSEYIPSLKSVQFSDIQKVTENFISFPGLGADWQLRLKFVLLRLCLLGAYDLADTKLCRLILC